MTNGLRDGVSFCGTGGRHFFFDRRANRYFALREADEQLFSRLLDRSCKPLDPGALPPTLTKLLGADLQEKPVPFALAQAPSVDVEAEQGSARPIVRLRALLAFAMARVKLACCAPERLFDAYAAYKPRISTSPQAATAPQVDRVLVELGWAFKWVQSWSGEGQCLPLSLGFARLAYALGYPVAIVFAVTPRPFGAHCWVQFGPTVLNDSLNRVESFTPIYAI